MEGKLLSYESLSPILRNLRLAGYVQLEKDSSKHIRFMHVIYMRAMLILIIVYTMQQALKIYEVRDNIDLVMNTMFLFMTHTDCIYKNIVLWKKADQIDGLLSVMKGPIFNKDQTEHQSFQLDTARKASNLLKTFNYLSLLTCFLWVLHSTILHLQGKSIELQIWVPFDANKDPQYYLAILYVWVLTSLVAFGNSSVDIFIAFSLEQCRTQLSILRFDLENVIERTKRETMYVNNDFDEIVGNRFADMIIHHKEIVKMTKNIQEIFGGAVMYQFMLGAWILCTSAYTMVDMKTATIGFMSMALYVFCILIELMVYCYYGSELTVESMKITNSAYAMNWLELPVKHRRTLIIFMERIKLPICPIAGMLVPLSNSTFLSIVRSSYSFYAFLKNSHN